MTRAELVGWLPVTGCRFKGRNAWSRQPAVASETLAIYGDGREKWLECPWKRLGVLVAGVTATEGLSPPYGQNSGILDGVSHGGVGMRLNIFNAEVQFGRGGEGKTLQELGLIDLVEAGYEFEAVPTAKLKAMFDGPVNLTATYPLLAELSLCYKNTQLFINQRHVEWGLRKAGITPDGLELLEDMLAEQADKDG